MNIKKYRLLMTGLGTGLILALYSGCGGGGSSSKSFSQGTGNTSGGTTTPTSKVLSTTIVAPANPLWGWAAVTYELEVFYKTPATPFTQCQIVTAVDPAAVDCCSQNCSTYIATISDFQDLLNNSLSSTLAAGFLNTNVSFQEIINQINGGNPLVILFSDYSSSGHAALIVGYDTPSQSIYVDDPGKSSSTLTVPYATALTYLGNTYVWSQTIEAVVPTNKFVANYSSSSLVQPDHPLWGWVAASEEMRNLQGAPSESQCQLVASVGAFDCNTFFILQLGPNSSAIQSGLSPVNTTVTGTPVSFQEVTNKINANKPVMILFNDYTTSGHVALIVGYDSVGDIYIDDPKDVNAATEMVPFGNGTTFIYGGVHNIWGSTIEVQ